MLRTQNKKKNMKGNLKKSERYPKNNTMRFNNTEYNPMTNTYSIYIHNIIYIVSLLNLYIYIYHYIMSCPKILYPKIQSSSKKNPRNLHLDSGQYRPTGEPNSPRSQILAGDRLEKNKKKWIGLREHLKRKPQI